MNEDGTRLAARVEEDNAALIDFLSGLTAADLRAGCHDHAGATVGAVAAHLADGAGQVLRWLDGGTGRARAAAAAGTGHGHAENDADVPIGDVIELLGESGARSAALLRGLTDDQLGAVLPAADGIADGKTALREVVADMLAHQAEHVHHMRSAVADERQAAS